jgi:hypothetical protein
MIRTVADVAITEVTIWQQCVITSRDKKEEKMKLISSLKKSSKSDLFLRIKK